MSNSRRYLVACCEVVHLWFFSRLWRTIQDVVSVLYEALADGVRFIRQNMVTAKGFLPKYTPMEPDVATKSGLYKWVLLNEEFPMEGLQELADIMTNEGVLREKVDAIGMLLTMTDLKQLY